MAERDGRDGRDGDEGVYMGDGMSLVERFQEDGYTLEESLEMCGFPPDLGMFFD